MNFENDMRRLVRGWLPGFDSRGSRTTLGLWAELGALVLSRVAQDVFDGNSPGLSSHGVLEAATREWLQGTQGCRLVKLDPASLATSRVPPFLFGTRAGVAMAVRAALDTSYGTSDDARVGVRVDEVTCDVVNQRPFRLNEDLLGGAGRLGRRVRVLSGAVTVSVEVHSAATRDVSAMKTGRLWTDVSAAIRGTSISLAELRLALPAIVSSTLGTSGWALGRGFTLRPGPLPAPALPTPTRST